jgi:hypothetical protein
MRMMYVGRTAPQSCKGGVEKSAEMGHVGYVRSATKLKLDGIFVASMMLSTESDKCLQRR